MTAAVLASGTTTTTPPDPIHVPPTPPPPPRTWPTPDGDDGMRPSPEPPRKLGDLAGVVARWITASVLLGAALVWALDGNTPLFAGPLIAASLVVGPSKTKTYPRSSS